MPAFFFHWICICTYISQIVELSRQNEDLIKKLQKSMGRELELEKKYVQHILRTFLDKLWRNICLFNLSAKFKY